MARKIDSTGQEKGKKIEDLHLRHIQMNFVRKLNFYYKGVILLAKEGKIKYNNATEDVEVEKKEKLLMEKELEQ